MAIADKIQVAPASPVEKLKVEDIERVEVEAAVDADEVYGAASKGGPDYTNTGWAGSAALMAKSQLGLGVLSLPHVFEVMGLIPGILVLLLLAVLTTWSGYVVGTFKLRHRSVHSIADVGFLFFGPVGREVFGLMYWLYMTMITGAALLSISIALNAVSSHAVCTVVFVVVGAIAVFSLASIQTLAHLSYLGWIGLASIMGAIMTLTVAVSLTRPSLAPAVGPWSTNLKIIGNPSFSDASAAMATVVFAFGGTPSYFTIISEMRDVRHYTKAMLTCQGAVTAVYIIIATIVYYYAGQYVATPALGTAGPLLKKISYGIALPSLVVAGVLYSHLPAKYIFVRLLRGSKHLSSNSFFHWAVWISCVGFCVLFSFIVASAIPVFNSLISLIGAIFGTFMALIVMGAMWLFDNWGRRHKDDTWQFRAMVAWNVFVIIAGFFLMIAGTYGSIVGILLAASTGDTTQPFSCADNSG